VDNKFKEVGMSVLKIEIGERLGTRKTILTHDGLKNQGSRKFGLI